MRFDAVRAAIEQRFQAAWVVASAPRTPVVYANAPAPSELVRAWVRLSIQYGDARRVTIGAPLYRLTGITYVQVFTALYVGGGEALGLADAAADVFRDVTLPTAGGGKVVCRTPSLQVVGASGAWWQVNVQCPFDRDAA